MSTNQDMELVRAIRGDSWAKAVALGAFAWAGSSLVVFLAEVRWLYVPDDHV